MSTLQFIGVNSLPDIHEGAHIADLIAAHQELHNDDVVIVASKIIAKAEGRVVPLHHDDSAARNRLIESESVRIIRRRGSVVIAETPHGFICASAGVDFSNVDAGHAVLLPRDPDRTAFKIRERLRAAHGVTVGVIISDTFGRAWREGVVNVALGCAGIAPLLDLRGSQDAYGNTLLGTQICIVDELAAAAELVMGKARQVPVVVARGVDPGWLDTTDANVASAIIRKPDDDWFR